MNFQEDAIFQPILVLMIQTLIIMLYMFVLRIRGMNTLPPEAQQAKTSGQMNAFWPARARAVGDNYANLAELPILFYAITLGVWMAGHVDEIHIYCAWGFVITRILHSVVHTTYNNVMHRFGIFMIGVLFLIVMVVREAIRVL